MNRNKSEDKCSEYILEKHSPSVDKARDDLVVICPDCHKEFHYLSFHQYSCQSSASDEELETKIKRAFWPLQTVKYATNSKRYISSLFGLDEIDQNFVIIMKELSRYVHTQNDFVRIVKRLRRFIIEEGGLERINEVLSAVNFDDRMAYSGTFIKQMTSRKTCIMDILRLMDFHAISIRQKLQMAMDFDMNDVVDELEHHTCMAWDMQASGSSQMEPDLILGTSSDQSRIPFQLSVPSVFSDRDYLLWPTQIKCRIEFSKEWPCYCRVFVTNAQELPLAFQDIINHEKELTSSKFKDYIFPVFDSFVVKAQSNVFGIERITQVETCPAYTIKAQGMGLFGMEYDLVPCLRISNWESTWFSKNIPLTYEELAECNVYVVPKPPMNDVNGLWRISSSSLEQKIIRERFSMDERNSFRYLKVVLKTMKNRYPEKDDWKLSSYHITSFIMNEHGNCSQNLDFPHYQSQASRAMINALRKKLIPHFFITELNLLQDVDDEECELFIQALEGK